MILNGLKEGTGAGTYVDRGVVIEPFQKRREFTCQLGGWCTEFPALGVRRGGSGPCEQVRKMSEASLSLITLQEFLARNPNGVKVVNAEG